MKFDGKGKGYVFNHNVGRHYGNPSDNSFIARDCRQNKKL